MACRQRRTGRGIRRALSPSWVSLLGAQNTVIGGAETKAASAVLVVSMPEPSSPALLAIDLLSVGALVPPAGGWHGSVNGALETPFPKAFDSAWLRKASRGGFSNGKGWALKEKSLGPSSPGGAKSGSW